MRTRSMAVPLLGLAVLLAACGSAAASPSAAPVTAVPASPAPPSEAPSAAADAAAINLADTSLGKVLVDGTGMSLYMFTADSGGTSACSGDCLASWPALIGDAAPRLGTGLDAEDFATIARDDGARQVTFHGMPLYTFAGDAAAGDVNGQGVGDKWYVVRADGTVVK